MLVPLTFTQSSKGLGLSPWPRCVLHQASCGLFLCEAPKPTYNHPKQAGEHKRIRIKLRNHVTAEEHEPDVPGGDALLQEWGRHRIQGEHSSGGRNFS